MKGNEGECQGIVQEWRQSAWGTQGNAGECRGIEGNDRGTWEWVQSARGMHGNAGECQANVWECKVPGECREMTGESTRVEAVPG